MSNETKRVSRPPAQRCRYTLIFDQARYTSGSYRHIGDLFEAVQSYRAFALEQDPTLVLPSVNIVLGDYF